MSSETMRLMDASEMCSGGRSFVLAMLKIPAGLAQVLRTSWILAVASVVEGQGMLMLLVQELKDDIGM